MENKTQQLLDDMLLKFSGHLTNLSPRQKGEAFIELETQFSVAVSNLKQDQTYIELGEEVERTWGNVPEDHNIAYSSLYL